MSYAELEKNEYYMHFIGHDLYGIRNFCKEAERESRVEKGAKMDANRAISFNLLRQFEFGDIILLAEHVRDSGKSVEDDPGAAVIFGYMRVNGVSHNVTDPEILKNMYRGVEIESSFDGGGASEERACGSYGIGLVSYVSAKETLKHIVDIWQQAAREVGKSMDGFKYFIRGQVVKFEAPIVLEPMKFSRGYRRVKLDESIQIKKDELPKRAVFTLYDYKKRSYMPKVERRKMDNVILDMFFEAVS